MNNLYEKLRFTEQQCIDAAIMVGKTREEGIAYYEHFGATDFEDGCNRQIKDVRLHMMRLIRSGWWPPLEGEAPTKGVKLFPLHGKICGKCGVPAVYKAGGAYGDNYYCKECIPRKTKERMREQGYDV